MQKEFSLHSEFFWSSLQLSPELLLLGNHRFNLIGVNPSADYKEMFKINLNSVAGSMVKLSETEILLGMGIVRFKYMQ
jgi:hypothetical protein